MTRLFSKMFLASGGIILPSLAYASMPQLDTTSYLGQIFWLFISFCTMYVLMARFALPHVRMILERREEVIQNNLEQASQTKASAEDIKISYDTALRQADQKADDYLKEESEKLAKIYAQKLEDANGRILGKIQKTEKSIHVQMQKMKEDVEADAEKISHDMINMLMQGQAKKTRVKARG